MKRRSLIHTALASAAAGALAHPGWAQGIWPSKPVTYIVPFPAGGTTDILGRLIGQKLGPVLGTTIVIDNKGGAGGSVGSELASRAPADGYTLLGGTISSHAINVSLYPKLGYDPIKSFSPVVLIGSNPVVLVVGQNSPLQDFAGCAGRSESKTQNHFVRIGRQRHFAASVTGTAGLQIRHPVHPRTVQGQRPGHSGCDWRPGRHDV